MPSKADHGTRTKYVAGCRCGKCCEANTVYQQKLKNRKRTASLSAVPFRGGPPQPEETQEAGRVEAQVIAELATLSAARNQPGLTEAALQMARILDAPELATTQPSAMRQLTNALEKLRAASAGRSGRLASVAIMSQRGSSRRDETG